MTDIATLQAAAHDPVPALLTDLMLEFGDGADAALAAKIVDAEAADFHWAARVDARRIGALETLEGEAETADCFQILGYLGGGWFVASVVVDGEGQPDGMRGVRRFGSLWDAYEAFEAND